jgi:hypothetical protein
MRMGNRRRFWRLGLILPVVVLSWLAGAAQADDPAAVRAALEQASTRYRVLMRTLETRGREETSAEVARFREAWQTVIDRLKADRPDDAEQAALLFQVDSRIVGAMIVVDIGSREGAREALTPIAKTLEQLSERAAPR